MPMPSAPTKFFLAFQIIFDHLNFTFGRPKKIWASKKIWPSKKNWPSKKIGCPKFIHIEQLLSKHIYVLTHLMFHVFLSEMSNK